MAFTKFATIVFLVGFLTAQVSCTVTPACYHATVTETTTTETSTVAIGAGAGHAMGAGYVAGSEYATGAGYAPGAGYVAGSGYGMTTRATVPPPYYDGTPNYFNNGLPAYSRTYPFYNSFGHHYDNLLTDYDINRELASYSYKYNMPATGLLNMYNMIHETMPTLLPQNNLNMIRGLAEAWQAEQLGYVQNYRHPLIDELYIDNLYKYVPSNYPRAYLNQLGYLDSKIPRLSDSTYNSIYRSIYDNASVDYSSRAEYLSFVLGTSFRYMSFNYAASWSMAY